VKPSTTAGSAFRNFFTSGRPAAATARMMMDENKRRQGVAAGNQVGSLINIATLASGLVTSRGSQSQDKVSS